MRCASALKLVLALTLFAAAGCARLGADQVATNSPLDPPRMSPDSVVLEVFFVRLPQGDPAASDALWQQVDEQALDADLRQALAANGFRAGVVGTQMPPELERLLRLTADPQAAAGTQSFGEEAKVVHRRLHVRAGKRSELIATAPRDRLPVLVRQDGEPHGRVFQQAQTVFCVRSFPDADGRVRLELTPEIQHGPPRQRYQTDAHTLGLIAQMGREREPCPWLKLQTRLMPGQVLLLGCWPSAAGSLGQAFFTEPTGEGVDQKLMVLRLAQTQQDDLFADERQPAAEQ